MKLTRFQVTNFKNIWDSGVVDADNITCLVGKNESGKTAMLEALCRLNPVRLSAKKFDLASDFPRGIKDKEKKKDKKPDSTVIQAWFDLNNEEHAHIEDNFGEDFLNKREIKISKNYNNKTFWLIDFNEQVYVKHFMAKKFTSDLCEKVGENSTFADLLTNLEEDYKDECPEEILVEITEIVNAGVFQSVHKLLKMPRFFYFDEYSSLPGSINLKLMKAAQNGKETITDEIETAIALLRLADTSVEELENQENPDENISSLESASNDISDELFEYWSQNKDLEVKFELRAEKQDIYEKWYLLLLRIYNKKHRASVAFEKRSKGFVWFFSFLVAFSQHKNNASESIVLLLDEPGLNLHAKAQHDLLNYFSKELLPHHQVVYTTHSPFMIDPKKLENVRTVEDTEHGGVKVRNDSMYCNSDTLFPMQAALGYDLAQTLFVGPRVLLVEGPSDLIYLSLAAEKLNSNIFDYWTITPVGGTDKLSTFVSLLGPNNLDIALAIDVNSQERQRITNLEVKHKVKPRNIITFGDILNRKSADIEDMITPSNYLHLVEEVYSLRKDTIASLPELKNEFRIVKWLEQQFKKNDSIEISFSHYKPAYHLQRSSNLIEKIFDQKTLNNFNTLFERLNNLS